MAEPRSSKVGSARAAIAAALLASTLLATGCEEQDRGGSSDNPPLTEIAVGEFDPAVPTWTEGSILHTPDASYDLGTEVLAYVRTSVGIVFVAEHEELVYSWTGGEPVKVGRTFFGGEMLFGDPESPYAAWQQPRGRHTEVVVFDQRRGRRVPTEGLSGNLIAIDGSDLYLRHQMARISLSRIGKRGSERVHSRLVAAQGEIRAFDTHEGIAVGTDWHSAVRVGPSDSRTAVFSPDARWVSTGGDDFEDGLSVYDARTGRQRQLASEDFGHATGFEWLDDGTLMAWGTTEFSNLSLLRCELATGSCSVVAEVDLDLRRGPLVAVPGGWSLWATWN